MSISYTISVQFPVSRHGALRLVEIAGDHAGRLTSNSRRDVMWFLTAACRAHDSWQQGLFTWGCESPSVDPYELVSSLRSFWTDIYAAHVMTARDSQCVVVMAQLENDPGVLLGEIGPTPGEPSRLRVLWQRTTFPLFGSLHERPDGLLPPQVTSSSLEEEQP